MSHDNNRRPRSNYWCEKARIDLEEVADRLLAETHGPGRRAYTERQLARKIRLEDRRMIEVEETSLPTVVVDYILREHARLLVSSAVLSKLQAAVLTLSIRGLRPIDIAAEFGVPYWLVDRALRQARARLMDGSSPYEGLYEVYWSEVHRYIYRRPRGK